METFGCRNVAVCWLVRAVGAFGYRAAELNLMAFKLPLCNSEETTLHSVVYGRRAWAQHRDAEQQRTSERVLLQRRRCNFCQGQHRRSSVVGGE